MLRPLLALSLAACGPTAVPDDLPTSDADPTTDASDPPTDAPAPEAALTLQVTALVPNEAELRGRCALRLPAEYECDQPSPAVSWSGAPAGTQAFVLVFDDPDAGDYPHWAVYDLPPDASGIGAGASGKDVASALPDGASELENGFGWVGYLGSCPGAPHAYRWRLWATDRKFDGELSGSAKRRFTQLATWAEAHALARAETCHVYGPATGN